MANDLQLTTPAYKITRTGLDIQRATTLDEWRRYGDALKAVDEAKQWAIGDWLVDGKSHYGDDTFEQASELLDIDESTLRHYYRTAYHFPLVRRTHKLKHEHHKTVASIKLLEEKDGKLQEGSYDTEKQQELLALAEKENFTVLELRNEVRDYKEWQRQRVAAANEPKKYAIIYADPPWQYTSGDQHGTEEQETVLGSHYPSMPLADICALPQAKLAGTDCVLFLWCTSPTLEEAFSVIRAWGFKYKASMVWDKVAHNVGHYVSVRHELLLIATKGQPSKVTKLVDSVYVEERTEHSRKPIYFRELIDELYPVGRRIELFCRGDAADGWDSWGDEAK